MQYSLCRLILIIIYIYIYVSCCGVCRRRIVVWYHRPTPPAFCYTAVLFYYTSVLLLLRILLSIIDHGISSQLPAVSSWSGPRFHHPQVLHLLLSFMLPGVESKERFELVCTVVCWYNTSSTFFFPPPPGGSLMRAGFVCFFVGLHSLPFPACLPFVRLGSSLRSLFFVPLSICLVCFLSPFFSSALTLLVVSPPRLQLALVLLC